MKASVFGPIRAATPFRDSGEYENSPLSFGTGHDLRFAVQSVTAADRWV